MIIASQVANLSEILAGRQYVSSTIGPDHELIVLSVNKPDYKEKVPLAPPFSYLVHKLTSNGWQIAVSVALDGKSFSFAQPLSEDRWLFVEARMQKRDAPNAFVYSRQGEMLGSFVAGDGIEHIQTTASGEVWVAYFDEGVYGGGDLEYSGLVCLDEAGRPLLRYWYDTAEPNSLPCIDDCYALNVSDDGVWVCYYSNFPIVYLRNRALEQAWVDWPCKAVRAFAVHNNKALMVAAYRRDGLLYSVDLRERTLNEASIVGSDGKGLHFDRSFARGPLLCFASLKDPLNQALFTVDLRTTF